MEYWLASAIVCGLIGMAVGKAFGRLGLGLALGALFGPLGVVIILVVGLCTEEPRQARSSYGAARAVAVERVPCPMCREQVIKGAKICPHCRSALEWPEEPQRRPGVVVIKRPRKLVVKPR